MALNAVVGRVVHSLDHGFFAGKISFNLFLSLTSNLYKTFKTSGFLAAVNKTIHLIKIQEFLLADEYTGEQGHVGEMGLYY